MACAAGYEAVALDIFADVDTQAMASRVLQLPYADGGFEPAGFEAALSALSVQDDVYGFVYGSGFEAAPELLNIAAAYMPVIGNSAEVVAEAKAVPGFFNLLARLEIPYPETLTEPPAAMSGWLSKHAGGSGGTHIRRMSGTVGMLPGAYYQRELIGVPVSALFAADGAKAVVIGYNRQSVSAFADLPFRYGGLVSNADLPDVCCEALYSAAQKLTQALQLRGINSVDAILALDGQTYILELNPRLTASAGLYRARTSMMQMHLNASQGMQVAPDVSSNAQAQAVFYAAQAFVVPEVVHWPEWVADIPLAGSSIAPGYPVCTVYAEARTATAAWDLVQHRLQVVSAIQHGKSIARHADIV